MSGKQSILPTRLSPVTESKSAGYVTNWQGPALCKSSPPFSESHFSVKCDLYNGTYGEATKGSYITTEELPSSLSLKPPAPHLSRGIENLNFLLWKERRGVKLLSVTYFCTVEGLRNNCMDLQGVRMSGDCFQQQHPQQEKETGVDLKFPSFNQLRLMIDDNARLQDVLTIVRLLLLIQSESCQVLIISRTHKNTKAIHCPFH